MESITVSELLEKTNLHLDLPIDILDMKIADPFRMSDEYIVTMEDNKTNLSFEDVKYIFDTNNSNAILTMVNNVRTYSFDENGEISSIEN